GAKARPALKAVAPSKQPWRDAPRPQGCLDGDGARAAHGVDERPRAVPAGDAQHGSGECLLDGRLERLAAIATAVQRLPRQVEEQLRLISRDVHDDAYVWVIALDIGARAEAGSLSVDDGVFRLLRDEPRVGEQAVLDRGADTQAQVRLEHVTQVERSEERRV